MWRVADLLCCDTCKSIHTCMRTSLTHSFFHLLAYSISQSICKSFVHYLLVIFVSRRWWLLACLKGTWLFVYSFDMFSNFVINLPPYYPHLIVSSLFSLPSPPCPVLARPCLPVLIAHPNGDNVNSLDTVLTPLYSASAYLRLCETNSGLSLFI